MTTTPLPPSEGWELDYDKLIADAFANHKYRQGTRECVAFKNGAHWAMHNYATAARADLEAEVARLKADYERACGLVADMHAAATGAMSGPKRGVVEDVADLRAENKRLREALEAIAECCDEDHAARDYASRQTEILGMARAALKETP